MFIHVDEKSKKCFDLLFKNNMRTTVTADDLIFFTVQAAAMFKAGISFTASFEIMADNTESERLKEAIQIVSIGLSKGEPFSKALEQYPDIFPEYYIKNIKAGEISGNMQEVLYGLVDYLKAEKMLKQEINSTFRYPIILFSVILLGYSILFLIQTYNVKGLGNLISVIDQKVLTWGFLYKGVTAISILYVVTSRINSYLKYGKGKEFWDRFRFRMWIIGSIYLKKQNKTFSELFLILYKSGISIIDVFKMIGKNFENKLYGEDLIYTAELLEGGKKVSEAIENCRYFPFDLKHIFHVGVQTGEFDRDLQFFIMKTEREIKFETKKVMTYIYVILNVLAGLLVVKMAFEVNW